MCVYIIKNSEKWGEDFSDIFFGDKPDLWPHTYKNRSRLPFRRSESENNYRNFVGLS